MSWQALEAAAPDLAAYGADRLTAGVSYLATVAQDGAPRVHPVTAIVSGGHLFVFMEPTSPKGRDLDRGSGYALHCAVEDADGGRGEFRVRGSGQRIHGRDLRSLAASAAGYEPAARYVLFELLLDEAFSTTYEDDGTPVRRTWRPSG
ncbi:hypothetical protein BH23ACT9_BH23ACT9_36260 [soil metagenome]